MRIIDLRLGLGLAASIVTACSTLPQKMTEDKSAKLSEPAPIVSQSDFMMLTGGSWNGTLTYLDYSSGTRVTIPAGAKIMPKGDKISVLISYPEEPWEDSKETLSFSKDGRELDGHTLISRSTHALANLGLDAKNFNMTTLPDIMFTRFVTEHDGKDNGKPAKIRMQYIVHPKALGIYKNVKTDENESFVNRNVYSFTRP